MIDRFKMETLLLSFILLVMGRVTNGFLLAETLPHEVKVTELAKEVHRKGWLVYTGPSEKGDWDLFLMRPDGSALRNLTHSPDFHEIGARFSPDGKRLLYRRIPKHSKVSLDSCGTQGELVIANSDGSEPETPGKPGEFPWASWGPDGRQIACLSKTGIDVFDLSTKRLLRKLERKGIYQQLVWSPDGKSFCGPANYYGEVWTVVRMDFVTGAVNPVSKYQNCTPDWFPDSQHLIFSYRPANQEALDGEKKAQAVGQKLDYRTGAWFMGKMAITFIVAGFPQMENISFLRSPSRIWVRSTIRSPSLSSDFKMHPLLLGRARLCANCIRVPRMVRHCHFLRVAALIGRVDP
ncbi:MAG: hypothetical protein DMG05_21080 [Acidobacteria bacterium]|nr:MAG: hypothetical protein DMG05_21080 [Acidobacteriota bacterium]